MTSLGQTLSATGMKDKLSHPRNELCGTASSRIMTLLSRTGAGIREVWLSGP